MCSVCGCSQGEIRINGRPSHETHDHHHHHVHHAHNEHHAHRENGVGHNHHHTENSELFDPRRLVQIEQNILAENQKFADANRTAWNDRGLFSVNLLSSPGAGKTTLLVETLQILKTRVALGVIEGDQQTSNDAARIRLTGVAAVQINTGRGCHLDAHSVGHAAADLTLENGILFIENIGNLVCPAGFDLGEHKRVVLLSVTEGADKPAKYPDVFAGADLMLISKIDLLPHVDFDVAAAVGLARDLSPDLEVIEVSARTGQGLPSWQDWLLSQQAWEAGRALDARHA